MLDTQAGTASRFRANFRVTVITFLANRWISPTVTFKLQRHKNRFRLITKAVTTQACVVTASLRGDSFGDESRISNLL